MADEIHIEDTRIYQAISEHLRDLNKSLQDLHTRISESLKRMDYMDKYKIVFPKN